MARKNRRDILAVLLIIFLSNCRDSKVDPIAPEKCKNQFHARLKKIRYEIGGELTYSGMLNVSDDFRFLFNNSMKYRECFKVFLKDSSNSIVEKEIAMYSMTGLEYHEYLNVLALVYDEFRAEKLSWEFLYCTISWVHVKEHPLEENYDEKEVIDKLKEIRSDKKVPEYTKELIDFVLSGKGKRGWLEKLGLKERMT